MAVPNYSDADRKLLKEAMSIEFGINGIAEPTYTEKHVELGMASEVKITHRAAMELIDTYRNILELERQKDMDLLLGKIQLGVYKLTGGSEGLYKLHSDFLEYLQKVLMEGRPVPEIIQSHLRPVTVRELESMTVEELRHVYREINHMAKGSIAIIPEGLVEGEERVGLLPHDIDAVPRYLVEPLGPGLEEMAALLRDHVPLDGVLDETQIDEVIETHELYDFGLEENGELFKLKE